MGAILCSLNLALTGLQIRTRAVISRVGANWVEGHAKIAEWNGIIMEDEEAWEQNALELPTVNATQVARRSLVLAAVVCRGDIDSGADQPEAESLHRRVLEWLTKWNLWNEITPSEEKMLRTPLGTLEAEDVVRATWYVEGLAILAWTLNYFEYPKHDKKVDPYAVTDALGFLSEYADDVITTAELRSPAELEASRELLYAIHARLRDFARNRKPMDFTRWVEKTWLDRLRLDASQLIVHNDLAIDGKTISEVEEDRLQECEWITRERHRAIIWLVEAYPSYSQTPVDT